MVGRVGQGGHYQNEPYVSGGCNPFLRWPTLIALVGQVGQNTPLSRQSPTSPIASGTVGHTSMSVSMRKSPCLFEASELADLSDQSTSSLQLR
jgi:hypothetical protein